MNYIQAQNISKAYGEKVLFSNISLSISQGQRVALIARNGTGKTTLMNILAGTDKPDAGMCTYKTDLKISYLPQSPVFDPELTVSAALLTSDTKQSQTIREYEEFIRDDKLKNEVDYRQRLQHLIERMDAEQAWNFEQRLQQVLGMLNINDLKAKVRKLSGGQQKRLALAKILMEEADFLLLDEPTNHLDIGMIEWLESFLGRQKTTLLMVTHDRYFLDAVCNEIIELENGQLFTYGGSYAHFLEKKQERQAVDSVQSEKAINLLRKEKEWMQRSPPARTTKSKARIQGFYDLQDKAKLQQEGEAGDIRMEMTRLGKKILELRDVSKSFGQLCVLDQFSYVFKRKERIGIVGPNGTGKSTLLNIITGSVEPDQGEVITGETIKYGYYRQEGLQADDNKKVIEVITDIADKIRLNKDTWLNAPQFLMYFNFPYHMHNDRVGKLSGGEKRRLYLLTVLMKSPNFLILDEPTNDLDIDTLNLLEDYLLRFEGCLLIVSHDRYFLDRLVEHVFVFRAPGDIKDFPGNYTSYRLKEASGKTSSKPKEKTEKPRKSSQEKEKTKLTYKEQREFESLETDIDLLEKERDLLLAQMNSGELTPDNLLASSERFSEVENLLNTKTDRWLELSEYT